MFFDFQGLSIKDMFYNFTNKLFCHKRKREEVDFNYNYLIKKRSQTPIYFENVNQTSNQNIEFINHSQIKYFQHIDNIKYHSKRSYSFGNKRNNLTHSNLQEDKNMYNEDITNKAIESINLNLKKDSEKIKNAEIKCTSTIIKPKFFFKTKTIKNENIISDINSSLIKDMINDIDFDDYKSFISFSQNKFGRSFPCVDLKSFESFIRY